MTSTSMVRLKRFGLTKTGVDGFMEYGSDWISQNSMTEAEYDDMLSWMEDANLLDSKSKSLNTLGKKLRVLGLHHAAIWATIWTNLAFRNDLCRWYCHHVKPGEIFCEQDLIFLLGNNIPIEERTAYVHSFCQTMEQTPIGIRLGQCVALAKTGKALPYQRRSLLDTETKNHFMYTTRHCDLHETEVAQPRGDASARPHPKPG